MKPKSRIRRVLLVLLIALVAWLAFDLFWPRKIRMLDFDPDEIARLETAMWRSYYDRKRVKLFLELAELLRRQYRMPLARSNRVAYQAVRAAFVFKDGKSRADYERALPNLVSFYRSIHDSSDIDFSVERAARLELEWWIVHRERAKHDPADLPRALAELAAELYRVPATTLEEHARLRAEAMTIRDTKAEEGGVSEADWARIDDRLHKSWRSLHRAVNR